MLKYLETKYCDIIMPVWNQPEITKNCVEAIIKNTGYPYHLILIDNGSDENTVKYLESLKARGDVDMELMRNEKNLGFVKAVNQGMRASKAPYLCVMNNDTIPSPHWLENLIEFSETHIDIGMMNPVTDGDPKKTLEQLSKEASFRKGQYLELNQCFLFATLIKREVIDRIGYLDEVFGIGCIEDADYAMRAGLAGIRCAMVYSSYVQHLHGVSFKALGRREEIVRKNEKEFYKKWQKPTRIAAVYLPKKYEHDVETEKMMLSLIYLARKWSWINLWVFGDKNIEKRRFENIYYNGNVPRHQNIRIDFFSKKFMRIKILAHVAERLFGTKKRKRFDIILVNDKGIYALLKSLKWIHRASVYDVDFKEDISGEK